MRGPGDYKIRATDDISDESVGRGVRVPATLIPPGQLEQVNHVLTKLRYVQVGHEWMKATYPPTLLSLPDVDLGAGGVAAETGEQVTHAHPRSQMFEAVDAEIVRRATSFLDQEPRLAGLWEKNCAIVAYSTTAPRAAQAWRFEWLPGKVQSGMTVEFEELDVDFLMTGDIGTWRSIIDGTENLSSCLRNGTLRTIARERGEGPGSPAGQDRGAWARRVRILTDLLQLGQRPR